MNSKTPTIGNDWSGTFPIELDNSGGPEQGAPLFGCTKDPTDPFSPRGVWFGYTPVGPPGGGGGPAGQQIYYVTELQHDSTTLYRGGSQGLMWLEINGNGPSGNVIF